MKKNLIDIPHVGEFLLDEFLIPLKMSQNALAKAIAVPPNRIHAIVNNTRKVTADTDLRLSRFFGLSDGYWLRIQTTCDLMEAKRNLNSKMNDIQPYVYDLNNTDDHFEKLTTV